MAEITTTRPFQQRFLDGFDRSQLRQEVSRVKPKVLNTLRKRYATWALGASLAFGGLSVPMKMVHDAQANAAGGENRHPRAGGEKTRENTAVAADLKFAGSIAAQVAGGLRGVVDGVTSVSHSPLQTVASAPQRIAEAVTQAPGEIVGTAESVKEHYFTTQIPFGSIIYSEAQKNHLSPELVAAVVHTESKFVPTARSAAGAVGLMQLIPKTGRWMGARDLTNPVQNIAAGTRYLRYLSDRFNGDEEKTIAAFNAGEGNVRRFGGVPPFQETRNYILRVRSFRQNLGDQMTNHAVAQLAAVR